MSWTRPLTDRELLRVGVKRVVVHAELELLVVDHLGRGKKTGRARRWPARRELVNQGTEVQRRRYLRAHDQGTRPLCSHLQPEQHE